jgi:hypothetical protein
MVSEWDHTGTVCEFFLEFLDGYISDCSRGQASGALELARSLFSAASCWLPEMVFVERSAVN